MASTTENEISYTVVLVFVCCSCCGGVVRTHPPVSDTRCHPTLHVQSRTDLLPCGDSEFDGQCAVVFFEQYMFTGHSVQVPAPCTETGSAKYNTNPHNIVRFREIGTKDLIWSSRYNLALVAIVCVCVCVCMVVCVDPPVYCIQRYQLLWIYPYTPCGTKYGLNGVAIIYIRRLFNKHTQGVL